MDDPAEWFERELIKRARQGDAEAGREILHKIALAIDSGRFDSPLFPFLAERLVEFLQGVPLEPALCVDNKSIGGAPLKYQPNELAAVDLILRDHAGFSPDLATSWIEDQIGADRRAVQRLRKSY